MVFFIDGGSNISGYAADPIYGGAALAAREHVVVVTINYRVGLFGWLDMSQIKIGDPIGDAGSFGLLDQIQAPKYVRDNIAAYLPVDKPFLGWNAVSGDVTNAIFTSATTKVLDTLSRQQPGQTWYDCFDWKQEPAPYDTVYGASHTMDLSFVFGNFGLNSFSFGDGDANAPGRLALSGAMMDTIGAFAANGNPTDAAVGGNWPNWAAMVVFDASRRRRTCTWRVEAGAAGTPFAARRGSTSEPA